jgi:hypothetical protein
LISLLVVVGLRWGVPPFSALERAGGDLGARMLWVGGFDENLSPGYIFVDVDEEACVAHPPPDPGDCRTGKPISAALIARFVRDIRSQGAQIVIVDVSPFEREDDRALLREALVAPDGPWIIFPQDGRPIGPSGAMRWDPATDLVPQGAAGRLRLASFVALTDADAGDALVRRYASSTPFFTDGGARRIVPSAPALAAMLLEPADAQQADCMYYRHCSGIPPTAREGPPAEIVYSLPSLAMLDADAPELDDAARSRAIRIETHFASLGYSRLIASKLLKAGNGQFAFNGQATGKVVVFGSSMPSAMDMHATPLGPMTGSEVVINAVRAFSRRQAPPATFEAQAPPGWAREFVVKAGAAVRGGLAMLPFWFGIHWVLRPPRRRGRRSRTSVVIRHAGAAAIFVLGLGVSLLVALSDAAEELRHSMALGRTVDVLTPVLLLGLEGYVEALKALLALIEMALLACFVRAREAVVGRIRWSRVLPGPAGVVGGIDAQTKSE